MSDELEDLATRYFAYYTLQASGAPERRRVFSDWEVVQRIVETEPQRGLALLKMLVDRAEGEGALGYVAGGPLEDYLCIHGPTMIENVLAYAESDSKFARALLGVWGENRMTREVWARLEKWRGLNRN